MAPFGAFTISTGPPMYGDGEALLSAACTPVAMLAAKATVTKKTLNWLIMISPPLLFDLIHFPQLGSINSLNQRFNSSSLSFFAAVPNWPSW
jgi:hypothetical protein